MTNHIDPDSFGFLIADLSRLIRAEIDRRIADSGVGVTAGEARTLAHAARAGAVRQNVLAERMGVEAMTLSVFLDKLEARGLIERRPDPADRRAKLVTLTARADRVLAVVARASAEVRMHAAAPFEPEEWERLLKMLKEIRIKLSNARAANEVTDKTSVA
jgi:DNA-binding MarR family transcriptional regulator